MEGTPNQENKRKKIGPSMAMLHKCQRQMIHSIGVQECHCKCCVRADRLSGLPDEILVSILSLLKLKEAAQTSILSRRWKNVWMYTTGIMDFYYTDMFDFRPQFYRFFNRKFRDRRLCLAGRTAFVSWVNHVLRVHKGFTIDEFKVSCVLFGQIRQTYIDGWVEFALRKGVKKLKLDFKGKGCPSVESYSLPKPLFLKYNLESLTTLSLKKVEVTGEVIQNILFKCRFLEVLCMEGASSLVELIIPRPLSQLKRLEIKAVNELKYLEIHAVNIESFTYDGLDIPVTFEKVPLLVEASFGNAYASYFVANIGLFASYICLLELLVLDFRGIWSYQSGVLPELPVLENLRQLELRFNGIDTESILNFSASWLEKCPLLLRFLIEVGQTRNAVQCADWSIKGDTKCLHSHLKLFELFNMNGFEEEAIVACSIASHIPSLEQVIFHPFFSPIEDRRTFIRKEISKCGKQLEKVLPPTVKLMIST